ncbi:hypothetical protein [Sphingomonas sp. XMGL2]|uniref:PAS domain-containing protein n=1 Tax=Sphingomonas quercus TaxID=2842451 RepID=A0ABS6BN60_9SPHN|nr:hypothetical protein [Sphingomonas quercus]
MDARALDDLWWLDGEEQGVDRPPSVASDERRLQVRAYNRWVALLRGRAYPSIDDLREDEGGFGDRGVVLDFSAGPANPHIVYLGEALRAECGVADVRSVADIPSRSLLSRLTDHYLQIIANRAPIGFEAEFVSQRGLNTLYRGILMPCSSDDVTIDYIYGVINWKELADHETTAELVLEVDRALRDAGLDELPLPVAQPLPRHDGIDPLEAARAAPALAHVALAASEEFVVLLARREASGGLSVLSTLPADPRLIESVARTL